MASTTAPSIPLFTYADLDILPKEREGDRQELFDGVLVVTPSPIPAHQIVVGNTTYEINAIVRPNDSGRVFSAPIDVVFAPKLVAVPDVVFVSRDRLHIVGPTAIDGPPDFIVEILSPSTRRRDLGAKRTLYERFGVPEYWLLDPQSRTATVLVLRDGRYETLADEVGAIRSTVVSGLVVEVAALFDGV